MVAVQAASMPSGILAPTAMERIGDMTLVRNAFGGADIRIRNDYLISAGKGETPLSIANLNAGTITVIDQTLGVDINQDASADYRFSGAVTFKLETGEKVTVHTQKAGPDITTREISKVGITSDTAGIILTGFSDPDMTEINAKISSNADKIDRQMKDNFVVKENTQDGGWLRKNNEVTQKTMNATLPGKTFGSGNNALSFQQLYKSILQKMTQTVFVSFNTISFVSDTLISDTRIEIETDDRDVACDPSFEAWLAFRFLSSAEAASVSAKNGHIDT